jgi:hypothetical protein
MNMRFKKETSMLALLAIVFCGVNTPVISAPLPISVIASASQASPGSNGGAWIMVHIENPDGSPKTDAQLPGPDPNGGVQLKGSKWSFQTLDVPLGYRQQTAANLGDLRIMTINNSGDGLYKLQIQPAAGYKGARKVYLKWVAGEYFFLVSYKDGNDQGTAVGVLRIP